MLDVLDVPGHHLRRAVRRLLDSDGYHGGNVSDSLPTGMRFGWTLVRLELPPTASRSAAFHAALTAVMEVAQRPKVSWAVVITRPDVVALLSGGEASTPFLVYPRALVAVTTEDGISALLPVLGKTGATS